MKFFFLTLISSLIGGIFLAWAEDGRDIALPDQYECQGCGGWQRYRQDQQAELLSKHEELILERQRQESEEEERYEELKRNQDSLIYEQRRQNELLEEQNRILKDIRDNNS